VGGSLGDTIGALALGLVAGHTLGLCYFLYKHKWAELDDVQHKYVYVSMFLASAVGVYYLIHVIVSIVHLVSILS
jgi:hypothetical protein